MPARARVQAPGTCQEGQAFPGGQGGAPTRLPAPQAQGWLRGRAPRAHRRTAGLWRGAPPPGGGPHLTLGQHPARRHAGLAEAPAGLPAVPAGCAGRARALGGCTLTSTPRGSSSRTLLSSSGFPLKGKKGKSFNWQLKVLLWFLSFFFSHWKFTYFCSTQNRGGNMR